MTGISTVRRPTAPAWLGRLGPPLALGAAVVAGGLLVAGTLTRGHDWGGDFAAYIMQARSLITGRAAAYLVANRFILEHSARVLGPVAYPWGFPVLLAPFVAAFGVAPLVLKGVVAACYLGLLLLLAVAGVGGEAWPWRLALVAFFAVDPAILGLCDHVLSDVPFLLVATAAVLWMDRSTAGRHPARDGLLQGALVATAFFLRANGLLLLPTLAVAQGAWWWRHRARAGGDGRGPGYRWLPYATFAVLVVLWRAVLPAGGSYRLGLAARVSLSTFRNNLVHYWVLPAHLFAGLPHPQAIWRATLALAVLGAVRRGIAGLHQDAWILGTVLVCLVWPVEQGLRFLLPVLPFVLGFALGGAAWLAGAAGARARRWRTAAAVVPVVAVLGLLGHRSLARVRANLRAHRAVAGGPFAPPAREMFEFVATHTPPDATVVFFKPRVMALLGHRRAFLATDPRRLSPGDELCLSATAPRGMQVSRAAARGLVAAGRARVVFENRRFTVYQVVAGAPAAAAPR